MLRPTEDLFYDFERDAWIEEPGIHTKWNEQDLPAPAVPPKDGAWLKPPPRFYVEKLRVPLVVATLALSYLALRFAWFYLVCAVAALQCLFILASTYRPRLSKADRRLIEDPDDLDVCLVDVKIMSNRRIIGVDRGIVWFGEGRLLFSGHRTSFALGGEDILPRSRRTKSMQARTNVLPLRAGHGKAVLIFDLILPRAGPGEREIRFVERLYAFRQRPLASRGPRQWPPFER